jgi:hypothetical protein
MVRPVMDFAHLVEIGSSVSRIFFNNLFLKFLDAFSQMS